jgi:nitrogenase molybdenum-iron protein alpha chain
VFTDVVGLDDTPKKGKFRFNILGEYNIGGDAFEIERIAEKCGLRSTRRLAETRRTRSLSARTRGSQHDHVSSLDQLPRGNDGKEVRIPWFKKLHRSGSLREVAPQNRRVLRRQDLIAQTEKVIEEEMAKVNAVASLSRSAVRKDRRSVRWRLPRAPLSGAV